MDSVRETIVDQIKESYARYIDAFNDADPAACATFYVFPYFEIGGPEAWVTVGTADEAQQHFAAAIEQLQAAGWASTRIDEATVFPFADNAAQLLVRVSRLTGDGASMGDTRVMYSHVRLGGDWKIAGYTYLAEGFAAPAAN